MRRSAWERRGLRAPWYVDPWLGLVSFVIAVASLVALLIDPPSGDQWPWPAITLIASARFLRAGASASPPRSAGPRPPEPPTPTRYEQRARMQQIAADLAELRAHLPKARPDSGNAANRSAIHDAHHRSASGPGLPRR